MAGVGTEVRTMYVVGRCSDITAETWSAPDVSELLFMSLENWKPLMDLQIPLYKCLQPSDNLECSGPI